MLFMYFVPTCTFVSLLLRPPYLPISSPSSISFHLLFLPLLSYCLSHFPLLSPPHPPLPSPFPSLPPSALPSPSLSSSKMMTVSSMCTRSLK